MKRVEVHRQSATVEFMFRIILGLMLAVSALGAEPIKKAPPYEEAIFEAKEARNKGLLGRALEKLAAAEKLDPKRVDAYFYRAQIYLQQRKSEEAVATLNQVIEIDPKASSAYQLRGFEHFKANRVEKSIEDFDRYIALEPRQAPYHWQRGLSLYYVGRFDEGRKQFELHQTVNVQDVENAVWHFLCTARADGIEKARASLIPISGDRRVPMSEIHDLFAAKIKPDDVLAATKKGNPTPTALEEREFYAHLYLGLYYEALGDKKQAYDHIKKAATDYAADHYMGDTARVHFKRLLENPPK